MKTMMIFFLLNAIGFHTLAFVESDLQDSIARCERVLPGMSLTVFSERLRTNPCVDKGTSLVFQSDLGVLFVCEKAKAKTGLYVATGSKGFGKTQEGDRKTPLGKYSLGQPRPSTEFGIFIPIGYPNATDIKNGFTGSDVGIHGPKRFLACAGALNIFANWTAGCLATASDQQVMKIALWLEKNPEAVIYLE